MTSCDRGTDILVRAREIATTVLFPATLAVDAAQVVPATHLDLLASGGFYGIAAPPDAGGPEVDFPTVCAIVETFASACLCTTFVWMQHHGVVLRLADGQSPRLRADWLPRLITGECRAGVVLGGALPGEPKLVARTVSGGYVLTGHSPWVTGWNMVDVLAVAARHGEALVWALLDARESATLTIEPLRMVAVSASNTVTVRFAEHPVPADRLIGTQDYAAWLRADAAVLRMNGSLALGLTSRCATLLGPGPLDAELAACRTRLDTATVPELPDARAQAAALAARAANTLVAATGSRAILLDQHAQKLAREALFLLVFASRPSIKQALLRRLIAPPAP
ncbi:MAG TPA: acyl-CoA dehydrogenase family protein [Streptosporangiaceae bacterium]|nr:acyl-CoA dehydrogenase family protein [Streptosporangiaceae bacterium]